MSRALRIALMNVLGLALFCKGAAGQPVAGGLPDPRQMHGLPRPDAAMPVGSLSVRLTFRNLAEPAPPSGVPVTLVGYRADGRVTAQTTPTGADGRALFSELDVTGDTAYYALAAVPRGRVVDRLLSQPIVPTAEQGIKLILSAETADGDDPPKDDAATLEPTLAEAVAANVVRVSVRTERPDSGGRVELKEARTGQVVAQSSFAAGAMGDVVNGGFTELMPDQAATMPQFEVVVVGGPFKTRDPMAGVTVTLRGRDVQTASTDALGVARFTPPKGTFHIVAELGGKSVRSGELSLTTPSARIGALLQWSQGLLPRSTQLAVTTTDALYAEASIDGQLYRSRPFAPVAGRGVGVTVYAAAHAQLAFDLETFVDDEYLGVRGNFSISNPSWIPYRAGPDGLEIPTPTRSLGLGVAPQHESLVSADRDGVFRIRRAIPPLGFEFFGGFSQKLEEGQVNWQWQLPFGAARSSIALREDLGAKFVLPAGARSEILRDRAGNRYIALTNIEVPKGGVVEFVITGLPKQPAWRVWVPRVAGWLGLMIIAMAAAAIIWTIRAPAPSPDAEISRLLAEVANAELAGRDASATRARLAELWAERDKAGA